MSAQDQIIAKYGLPGPDYQAKYCNMWDIQKDFPWFPAKRVLINTDFKAKLYVAFKRMEQAGVHSEIKTFDGCYNDRSVRGRTSKSLHAWAMAIDINASTEKLAQDKTNWSATFLDIMRTSGIFCGADWKGRRDSMHFSLLNG